MHIDDIIRGLSEPHDQNVPLYRQELLIRLVMWLRFSGQPAKQDFACIAGFLSYVCAVHGDVCLGALPPDFATFLRRNLNIGTLSDLLLGRVIDQPDFELFAEYGDDYHEYPYIADVVKFLLWYEHGSTDKRKQASLQKAYFFLMKEGFSHWAHFSRRYFIEQWSLHRNASPFLYVMYHHLQGDLLLDPRDPAFAAKIDALAMDRKTIPELLGQAKWVGERLEKRLHPKAQQGLQMPNFPASLTSIEIPPVIFDEYVRQSLEDYNSDIDTPED